MKQHFWTTWPGLCAIGLIAALAFYLLTEHTAHLFGALPYLIFLACPLMHLFMHHGHHKQIDKDHASHGHDGGA